MKKVKVVCGVVYNNKNEILITQRGDQKNYKKWEFPGGKVKPNEELNKSIKRELKEELNVVVDPIKVIYSNTYKKYDLIFIECLYETGTIELNEHLDYNWTKIKDLGNYNFLEGDKEFINYLLTRPHWVPNLLSYGTHRVPRQSIKLW